MRSMTIYIKKSPYPSQTDEQALVNFGCGTVATLVPRGRWDALYRARDIGPPSPGPCCGIRSWWWAVAEPNCGGSSGKEEEEEEEIIEQSGCERPSREPAGQTFS